MEIVKGTHNDTAKNTAHSQKPVPWASCQIRKIAGAHAPGMPGMFSPSPQVRDPDMHHGTCVTHVPWCMSGSLTCGFLWNRRRSRHSRRMRNLQFYVSGKRPIDCDGMQMANLQCHMIPISVLWCRNAWTIQLKYIFETKQERTTVSYHSTHRNSHTNFWYADVC